MTEMTLEKARELAELTERIADNLESARKAWEALPADRDFESIIEAAGRLETSLDDCGEAWGNVPADSQVELVTETVGRLAEAIEEVDADRLPSQQYLESLTDAAVELSQALPSN